MRNANNDNDELEFKPISVAAGRVLERLEAADKEHVERDRKTGRNAEQEQREKQEREYIEHRLRELAAFERRFDSFKRRQN